MPYWSLAHSIQNDQVHHILAEIIQGGLVLETNVDEIDNAGPYTSLFITLSFQCFTVQSTARLRKESYAASNPLALGGGLTPRGSNLQTPLGWLTGKLTGVGAR